MPGEAPSATDAEQPRVTLGYPSKPAAPKGKARPQPPGKPKLEERVAEQSMITEAADPATAASTQTPPTAIGETSGMPLSRTVKGRKGHRVPIPLVMNKKQLHGE